MFHPFRPPNPTRSTSSTSFPLSRRPPPTPQDIAPNSIGRSPAPTAPPWAVNRPSFSAVQPAEPLAPAPRRRRWHRRPRPAWALVGEPKWWEKGSWKPTHVWWIYMENPHFLTDFFVYGKFPHFSIVHRLIWFRGCSKLVMFIFRGEKCGWNQP